MKTLQHSCAFDESDIAQYRLKVIEFGRRYGWRAVQDAFNVKRSTYFLWQQKFTHSQGRLTSLVPVSTKPHQLRRMTVNPHILSFIRSIREQYGRIGKQKLFLLLQAYCLSLGMPSPRQTTIGKIIHRYHFFFEGQRHYHKTKTSILRVKKAPRETMPGYVEMDTVIVHTQGEHHAFITAIDVATKYAACVYTHTATARAALTLLTILKTDSLFPLRMIQTDNGSEFLGVFDQYCQTQGIKHVFTYPRSPRINGGIERFNRTIQEEFIDRTDSLLLGRSEIIRHLHQYLTWYNDARPHQSLGYLSPSQYLQTLQSKM